MRRPLGELSARDRRLLRVTGDLRLVTGGQLRRVVFGEPSASSQNARIARRALARLADAGLLARTDRTLGGLGGGSSSFVYTLTPRGARVLDRPPQRHRLDPSLGYLRHSLAVSEVYVQLHEASFAGDIVGLRLDTEPACWRSLEDGSGRVLKPDLFVHLTTAAEEVFAYVEVDLATEHRAAVRRKLDLYAAHEATGRDQSTFRVLPQVVWSVPDPLRRDTLRQYLAPETRQRPGRHVVVLADQLVTQLTKGGDHA